MSHILSELDFTTEETRDLVIAVSRNCACFEHDQAGTIQCAGHRSLTEQSELKRFLFARRMREHWRTGEFELSSREAV